MGGIITLNPVDPITVGTGWRNHLAGTVGSSGVYISDASDTTYISDSAVGASDTLAVIDFSDITTLPAGAAVKSVTPKVRASQAVGAAGLAVRGYRDAGSDSSAAYNTPTTTLIPTSVIKDYALAAGPAIPNRVPNNVGTIGADDYLDGFRVEMRLAAGGKAAEDHRIYKMWVDVEYVDPPTVDTLLLVDPADVSSTVRPRFQWSYSSPDGYPQYEYRTAVWALADVTAFPGGRTAFEANPENIFGDTSGDFGANGPSYSSDGGATWRRAKAWSISSGSSGAGRKQSSEALWTSQQDLPIAGAMVVYAQSAAQFEGSRLEGPSVASLDFTMAITPPAAPTAVTAVWQYPSAAAAADRNFFYRTKITVNVPAASIGAFTGRRLFVEHSIDGKNDWRLMPLSMQEIGATGGTFTFYDTMPIGGRTLRYRARTLLYTNTQSLPSSYLVGNAVDCIIDEFILRDPLKSDGTVVLRLQGDLESSKGEAVGEFRALNARLSTMVSDAILGRRWKLQQLSADLLGSGAFQTLRTNRGTLLFQTDMKDVWWWVKFGPDMDFRLVRQTNRRNPNKRTEFQSFELIETYAIPGQPDIWF